MAHILWSITIIVQTGQLEKCYSVKQSQGHPSNVICWAKAEFCISFLQPYTNSMVSIRFMHMPVMQVLQLLDVCRGAPWVSQ